MVTHPLRRRPLHGVPVGVEAVEDVVEILLRLVLHPQLQPMVL
jgi:hypothetical protein